MMELDRFRATFFQEAYELLQDMEERLLGLEAENCSHDDLDAIFRAAHSIKGSAGVFGFQALGKFTHVLETVLDQLREGKLKPTGEITTLLLSAKDALSHLVVATQQGSDVLPESCVQLMERLENQSADTGAPSVAAKTEKAPAADEEEGVKTWNISFKPHPSLFIGGNDPICLMKELARLGDAHITCHTENVPLFNELDPVQCYLAWSVELETSEKAAAIREVFEFVEDECDLTIEPAKKEAATKPDQQEQVKPPAAANAETPAVAAMQPSSIRVDLEKVDKLVNLVGEVVIRNTMISSHIQRISFNEHPELHQDMEALEQAMRELQEAVMSVRMQQVSTVFSRMPRLVRDTAAKIGKKITLTMEGEQTEVDKTIIERLSDPLTHMMRNAMDHGIEKPDVRRAQGKPEEGTIQLKASHRGGRILIEIIDDGAGINRDRVLAKAKERGIVAADAELSDEAIDQLIFAAGFSTAESVTDLSGRGVGMDVVKRNIEALGGTVDIVNHPGEDAESRISFPLTLAILDGMVVRAGNEYYIVPISNIVETLQPNAAHMKKLDGQLEVLNVRGEIVPLVHMADIFGIQTPSDARMLVVIVETSHERFGLVVEELVGQQQVVVKSLEENVDPIPGLSGATILGDGRVSLILDVMALSKLRPSQQFNQRRAA